MRTASSTLCFLTYIFVLWLWGLAALSTALWSMTDSLMLDLMIWDNFNEEVPMTLPSLIVTVSALMLLISILSVVGVFKRSIVILGVFVCLFSVVAVAWLGIGGWIASIKEAIESHVDNFFMRLDRDRLNTEFVGPLFKNLQKHHYRLRGCCPETSQGISQCATSCRGKYDQILFDYTLPAVFAITFGSGLLAALGIIFSAILCCSIERTASYY